MAYRAALIGCGKIGSEFADNPLMKGDVYTHAEAYMRCPDTELVAVCDSDLARLARCGERWNIAARHTSAVALIETERPDIVSVCTPDTTHYEVVRAILTRNHHVKAVLCEKPLATSPEQAQELIRLAGERGAVLAVDYTRRYANNLRALQMFLAAENLGTIQAVSGWYTKGTLHNGSHWFDLLRFLVGEVDWVMGINVLGEPGPDPTLDVNLGLKNGALATLRACDARRFTVFEMDIMGTLGRAQLLESCYRIELAFSAPSSHYSGYFGLLPVFHDFGDHRNPLLHVVEDLVVALRKGTPPACSGEDGLAAVQISWAAHESAQIGRRVYIADGN